MDLSAAIRAYQQAAEYYGQTQLDIAAASEQFQQATAAQQTAYGVLQTAQQELLKAARDVHLPGPAREYRGDGSRADVEALKSEPRRLKDQPQA
jgi:hypothetical protein